MPAAGRETIEAELAQLKVREAGWGQESSMSYSPPQATILPSTTSTVSSPLALQVQYSVEEQEDIPRSAREQIARPGEQLKSPFATLTPSLGLQDPVTILPLGGEQVLPPGRRAHPIVEPLLQQQRSPPPSGLPIVEAPSTLALQSAPQDSNQSLTLSTGQRAPPSAAAGSAGRRVLLLIPPNIGGELLLRCYQNVSKTIIHGDDQLVLLWTGLITDKDQESSGAPPTSPKASPASFALAPRKVFSVLFTQLRCVLLTSFTITHHAPLVGGTVD